MSAASWRRARSARGPAARTGVLHAACLLGAVFLLSSEAAADRISLLSFEGSNARALRWRVAGALKRSGHTVIGVAPPKNPSETKLRAFAKRRRVDLFIAGESVQNGDSWELTLTVRDPEGEQVGRGVTISAPSYRAMLKELKEDGASQVEQALRGGGGGGASRSRAAAAPATDDEAPTTDDEAPASDDEAPAVDADESAAADAPPAAGDFAARARALAKKKRRGEPKAIDIDGDAAASETSGSASERPRRRPASARSDDAAPGEIDADEDKGEDAASGGDRPRTAKAKAWSASARENTAEEDDGRDSFLADGSGANSESGEVGVDDASAAKTDGGASEDPTVVLGLNAGFVRRTLEYSDNLYGRLRAPSANSWVYRLQAAVYPFAKPVKNRIGLIAGYEAEFSGVVRDNRAGTDFGVTFSELYGGVKLRQPLGKHELALEGTLGSMHAGLDDPDGTSRVPEFSYTSLRGAVDLGLHFGALALRTALGYRLPIGGYGQASDVEWFPRMEGYGLEGSFGVEYRISKEVAFDVSGSMRRYLLQMNSRPDDAVEGVSEVAGGAIDLYLGGYFGLNITL